MAFSIKELEALSGIKAHTIRIWEQRYNFLKPSRTQTNIRTYNNEELKTLLTVALLNKYGHKISRIDEMQPHQRLHAVLNLSEPAAYHEHSINELVSFMVDLKSYEFEQALDHHIREKGMEYAITNVIFHFLQKTGILWQTNKILPAQEHIVSNIIRQKIVSAIDALTFVHKPSPLFILFLPEDEHHELGLLYVHYLLKKNNVPVLYLGANVPLKDIYYLLSQKKPEYLYMHLTGMPRKLNFQKFIDLLAKASLNSSIIISGYLTETYTRSLPRNVSFLKSLNEVVAYILKIK